MSELKITVPIGVGDILYLKAMLDNVKSRYSTIKIKFHRELIKAHHLDPAYDQFLDEIGALFFSEPPYALTDEPGIPFYGMVSICNDNKIAATKPNLAHLLCHGTPLDVEGGYIAMVTKTRYLDRNWLNDRVMSFWEVMNELSQKYKIVILGERVVEPNADYVHHNSQGKEMIYSIYDSIIGNIPNDKIIDCSIPALGQTSPKLSQIKQDCLLMNQAKFVVTLGVGGGFCMATSVAKKVVGFRNDQDPLADTVFSHEYPDAFVTKDWNSFIFHLRRMGA